MAKKVILSNKNWIHPDNEDIDQDAWIARGDRDGYFLRGHPKENYNLPPLREDVDASQVLQFTIGSLTRAQYTQQSALRMQSHKAIDPQWVEFVVRSGIKGWSGMLIESEGGKVEVIQPTWEETPYGKLLDFASYEWIVFFCGPELSTLVQTILHFSHG